MVMVGGVEIAVGLNYDGIEEALRDLQAKINSKTLKINIGQISGVQKQQRNNATNPQNKQQEGKLSANSKSVNATIRASVGNLTSSNITGFSSVTSTIKSGNTSLTSVASSSLTTNTRLTSILIAMDKNSKDISNVILKSSSENSRVISTRLAPKKDSLLSGVTKGITQILTKEIRKKVFSSRKEGISQSIKTGLKKVETPLRMVGLGDLPKEYELIEEASKQFAKNVSELMVGDSFQSHIRGVETAAVDVARSLVATAKGSEKLTEEINSATNGYKQSFSLLKQEILNVVSIAKETGKQFHSTDDLDALESLLDESNKTAESLVLYKEQIKEFISDFSQYSSSDLDFSSIESSAKKLDNSMDTLAQRLIESESDLGSAINDFSGKLLSSGAMLAKAVSDTRRGNIDQTRKEILRKQKQVDAYDTQGKKGFVLTIPGFGTKEEERDQLEKTFGDLIDKDNQSFHLEISPELDGALTTLKGLDYIHKVLQTDLKKYSSFTTEIIASIIKTVEQNPELSDIKVVGHSLGGAKTREILEAINELDLPQLIKEKLGREISIRGLTLGTATASFANPNNNRQNARSATVSPVMSKKDIVHTPGVFSSDSILFEGTNIVKREGELAGHSPDSYFGDTELKTQVEDFIQTGNRIHAVTDQTVLNLGERLQAMAGGELLKIETEGLDSYIGGMVSSAVKYVIDDLKAIDKATFASQVAVVLGTKGLGVLSKGTITPIVSQKIIQKNQETIDRYISLMIKQNKSLNEIIQQDISDGIKNVLTNGLLENIDSGINIRKMVENLNIAAPDIIKEDILDIFRLALIEEQSLLKESIERKVQKILEKNAQEQIQEVVNAVTDDPGSLDLNRFKLPQIKEIARQLNIKSSGKGRTKQVLIDDILKFSRDQIEGAMVASEKKKEMPGEHWQYISTTLKDEASAIGKEINGMGPIKSKADVELARKIIEIANKKIEMIAETRKKYNLSKEESKTLNGIRAEVQSTIALLKKKAPQLFNNDGQIFDALKEAGQDVSKGLNRGIDLSEGEKKGIEIGEALIRGAKKSLDIHSPSGKFKKIGKYVIWGLKEGIVIDEVKTKVEKDLKGLVKDSIDIVSPVEKILQSQKSKKSEAVKNANEVLAIAKLRKEIGDYDHNIDISSPVEKILQKNKEKRQSLIQRANQSLEWGMQLSDTRRKVGEYTPISDTAIKANKALELAKMRKAMGSYVPKTNEVFAVDKILKKIKDQDKALSDQSGKMVDLVNALIANRENISPLDQIDPTESVVSLMQKEHIPERSSKGEHFETQKEISSTIEKGEKQSSKTLDALKTAFKKIGENSAIGQTIKNTIESSKFLTSIVVETTKVTALLIKGLTKGVVLTAKGAILSLLTPLAPLVVTFSLVKKTGESLYSDAKAILGKINWKDIQEKGIRGVIDSITSLNLGIIVKLKNLKQSFDDSTQQIRSTISSQIKSIQDFLTPFAKGFLNLPIIKGVATDLGAVWNILKESNILGGLKADIAPLLQKGKDLINPIVSFVQDTGEQLKSFGQNATSFIGPKLNTAKEYLLNTFDVMVKGFNLLQKEPSEIIQKIGAKAKEITTRTFEKIVNIEKIKEAKERVKEVVRPAWEGLRGTKEKPGFLSIPGIKALAPILAAITLFKQFESQIYSFGQTSLETAMSFEKLTKSLSFVAGGPEEGMEKLDKLKRLAKETGSTVLPLVESYNQLSASTRFTPLEGETTDHLMSGVTKMSSIIGLSSEQIKGSVLALSQIAGKGVVSAEELRGQLAERIPGAFQIGARAMKTTEKELYQLMATGNLSAAEFLPKFADQLEIETEVNASLPKTTEQELALLQNKIQEIQLELGNFFLPFYKQGIKFVSFITDIIDFFVSIKGVLAMTAKTLAATWTPFLEITKGLGSSFVLLGKQVINLAKNTKLLVAAGGAIAAAFAPLIGGVTAFFASWAAFFGGLLMFAVNFLKGQVLIQVIERGLDVFNMFKLAVEMRVGKTYFSSLADNVENNIKRIEKAQKGLSNNTEEVKLENLLPKSSNGFARAMDEMLGVKPEDFQRAIDYENKQRKEKGLRELTPEESLEKVRSLGSNKWAFAEMDAAMISRGKIQSDIQSNFMDPLLNTATLYKSNTGPLAEIAQIEKRTKELKGKLSILDPSNATEMTSINKELEKLGKKRKDILAPLDAAEIGLRQVLESDKKTLSIYEEAKKNQYSDDKEKTKNAAKILSNPAFSPAVIDQIKLNIETVTKSLNAYQSAQGDANAINDIKKYALALIELGTAFSALDERMKSVNLQKLKEISIQQVHGFKKDQFNDANTGVRTASESYDNTLRTLNERRKVVTSLEEDMKLNPSKIAADQLIARSEKQKGRGLTGEEVRALTEVYAVDNEPLKQAMNAEATLRDEKIKTAELEKQLIDDAYNLKMAKQTLFLAKLENNISRIQGNNQRQFSYGMAGLNKNLRGTLTTDLFANQQFDVKANEKDIDNVKGQMRANKIAQQSIEKGFKKNKLSAEEYTKRRRDLLNEEAQLTQQLSEKEVERFRKKESLFLAVLDNRIAKQQAILQRQMSGATEKFNIQLAQGLKTNLGAEDEFGIRAGMVQKINIQEQMRINKLAQESLTAQFDEGKGDLSLAEYVQRNRALLTEDAQLKQQLAEQEVANIKTVSQARMNALQRIKESRDTNTEIANSGRAEAITKNSISKFRTDEFLTNNEALAQAKNGLVEVQNQLKNTQSELSELEAGYATGEILLNDYVQKKRQLLVSQAQQESQLASAEMARMKAVEDYRLAMLDRMRDVSNNKIAIANAEALTQLAQSQLSGKMSDSQVSTQSAKIGLDNARESLSVAKESLVGLQDAYNKKELSAEKYQERLRQINLEIAQGTQQVTEQELALWKANEQEKLTMLDKQKQKLVNQASIYLSQGKELLAKSQMSGGLSDARVGEINAQIGLGEAENNLGITTDSLRNLEIEYRKGGISLQQFTERQSSLLVELAQNKASIAEAELALLKANEQAKIEVLEKSLEKQDRLNKLNAVKLQIINKEKMIGIIGAGGASDLASSIMGNQEANTQSDSQIKLLQERLSGMKNILNPTRDLQEKILATEQELNESILNKRLTLLGQQLDYKKQLLTHTQLESKAIENQLAVMDSVVKLSQANTEIQKKRVETQIASLERVKLLSDEIGSSSLASVNTRSQMENTLTQAKLKSLDIELKMNRLNLDIEQQREKLSQRKTENESRMAVLQAKNTLLIAMGSGDTDAVTLAQQQLSIANAGLSTVLKQGQLMTELHDAQRSKLALETKATLEAERFTKVQENINSKVKIMNSYLDKQKERLDSINELNKAINNAKTNVLEKRSGITDKKIDLYDAINGTEKITDPKENPVLMKELQDQLRAIGGSTDPKEMYAERLRLEESLANQKMNALVSEQNMQKTLLQIEFDKYELQAQALILQAKMLALQSKGTENEASANQLVKDAMDGRRELGDRRDNAMEALGINQETERYNQGIENANAINETRRRSAEAGYKPGGSPVRYPGTGENESLDNSLRFGYTPGFDLNEAIQRLRRGDSNVLRDGIIPGKVNISNIPSTKEAKYEPLNYEDGLLQYNADSTKANTKAVYDLSSKIAELVTALTNPQEGIGQSTSSNTSPAPTPTSPAGPGGPGTNQVINNINYGGVTVVSSDPTGDARKVLTDLAKANKNKG